MTAIIGGVVMELSDAERDIAETLDLFAAGIEAYSAATVDVWEPPTHVSNTSGQSGSSRIAASSPGLPSRRASIERLAVRAKGALRRWLSRGSH